MMGISSLAEAAGLLDWLAAQAARFSGNSPWRLFLNTFLLGSLISLLLSNDATALINPLGTSHASSSIMPLVPYCLYVPYLAIPFPFQDRQAHQRRLQEEVCRRRYYDRHQPKTRIQDSVGAREDGSGGVGLYGRSLGDCVARIGMELRGGTGAYEAVAGKQPVGL